LTAADSPPEVHQWITSARGAAGACRRRTRASGGAATHSQATSSMQGASLRIPTIVSPFGRHFPSAVIVVTLLETLP
jgi:hypothetical protein